ncbi:hypothetical protein MCOR25_000383 [Pyricularia grisea]|uniref:Uncharacterized protein n=1 Tax=Pyricularia grisea TaxID=148305 RepID=A0A6P8AV86_PYRGI|nr:uncharacterized protein PgNI_08909 [Pyricularia grisea]KAI6382867.1 hypothetical protein MCOR25_000383 [Pyricularia grisea]TLD06136.1 hypothetical protein PgNI_08909 [Pyricularia grisea]
MPDLNSVSSAPRAIDETRQQSSHAMPPPPVAQSPSLNILPSNQTAHTSATTSSSALASPQLPPAAVASNMSSDNAGAGSGPGPIRHPRPLTAAELHLQLEKEQEAVVNRLTRELSILRAAQNASVVSNTSSTSASVSGAEGTPATDLISGSGFSIPSTSGRRHHRTSSSHSARSQAIMGTSFGAGSMVGTGPLPAPAGRPFATSLSRQNSTASRRSRASSPIPPVHHSNPIDIAPSGGYFQRGQPPMASSYELSPGLMQATHRYEEVAYYRSELESAKRENEILRRRIQELERAVRDRRTSDTGRTRSESVSTTASVAASTGGGATATGTGVMGGSGVGVAGRREGGGRDRVVSVAGSVGVGVPEDEVRVGESAASAGLGTAQSGTAGVKRSTT